MADDTYDVSKDKDFLAAKPEDQHAYLMATDPDYAKASAAEQLAYRQHVTGNEARLTSKEPTQFEKDRPQIPKWYGFTPSNLLHQGVEGVKDVGRFGLSVAKDISNPNKPLFFGEAESGPKESTFHKYALAPSEREFAKAQQGDQSGLESIGHSVAGGIPIIGPWVASLSEQAGTGDVGGAGARAAGQVLGAKAAEGVGGRLVRAGSRTIGPIMRTAGEMAGTRSLKPIGELPGRALEAIVPPKRLTTEEAVKTPAAAKFQPALDNTPAEVVGHAANEGIELTPGQATQMPVQKVVQAIGERSLIGSKELHEGIDRNAAAFADSVGRFADRVDPKAMGTSKAAAGEAIRQAAETGKDVSHTNASAGYKQIPDFEVDPAGIRKAWVDKRGMLPAGMEDQILAQVPRDMRAEVAEIMDPSGEPFKLSKDHAIALRSLFLDLGRTVGADLPTKSQGVFRAMSEAADKATESGAKDAGAERHWRQANQGWKDYRETYGEKSSPLYRILDQTDPAKITQDLMSRRSATDVEMLRKEKLDAAIEPLRRQVIMDIANRRFRIGSRGLGDYPHEFLNMLLGPKLTKELYLKGEIGRRFNWEMNPSGTSNVMIGEHQVTHPTPSRLGLLAGAARLARPRAAESFLPEQVYRSRQVGNPTIQVGAHSHAAMTLEEAQRLAPGRAALTPTHGGGPQEVVPIDLTRFGPHDFTIHAGPRGVPWIKFHRQLTPEDYASLGVGRRRLLPVGAAAAGAEQSQRLLPAPR